MLGCPRNRVNITQCQRWMATVAKGVAYTGVNIEDLKRLPLPLPSLEEQVEVAKRVDELMTMADGLIRRIDAAAARAEPSFQSVLAKTFRGEISVGGIE
ncbi:MAG: restriction endonuclease subunit S [Coriobacteriia bacterium]